MAKHTNTTSTKGENDVWDVTQSLVLASPDDNAVVSPECKIWLNLISFILVKKWVSHKYSHICSPKNTLGAVYICTKLCSLASFLAYFQLADSVLNMKRDVSKIP